MKKQVLSKREEGGTGEGNGGPQRLELVVKCDSVGSEEAVKASLEELSIPEVAVTVISSGVGDVSKSDLLMAQTGSRLIVGFSVGVMPKIGSLAQEEGIEIRLYDVIYRLTRDVADIARSLVPKKEKEKITGRAKVIALFKSSRRGIILGCEVLDGILSVGKDFRVISAMGPIYAGKIESLQIEKTSVREAKASQQVGLRISNFNKARVGDLIECFETERPRGSPPWQPAGRVMRFES